ncbi:putative PurR-regulated permease PerM [Bacilli bacterium PM5-3]|nr:putative PurR-regulated permease PerM [Bacilli bacterium PM5-3]MDH6603757.1 putative PurR-regulated permease PerM [Bacilli bacterium PM5-9]
MKNVKYQYLGFAIVIILINYAITNFSSFSNSISFIFSVVKPIIIGMVIAYFVYPIVNLLYKKVLGEFELKYVKHLSYYISVTISYVVLFFVLYMLYYWLSPIIVDSIANISKINLDEMYNELNLTWSNLQNDMPLLENVELVDIFKKGFENVSSFFARADLNGYFKSILGLTSSVYAYVMGVIVSIYMIISKEELFKACDMFFEAILKQKHFEVVKRYFLHFEKIFKKFFFGKMLDSLIIGILAFIGLYLLDVPFYPLLAVVIMVTNMIPYFGPFIGGIPVVIVTLFVTGSPVHALWSALFIFALQQFDGIYLGPKILGDSVGVSSVWILIAIIIGGALLQVVGLLLCVPVAATLRDAFKEFYEYRMEKRNKMEIE